MCQKLGCSTKFVFFNIPATALLTKCHRNCALNVPLLFRHGQTTNYLHAHNNIHDTCTFPNMYIKQSTPKYNTQLPVAQTPNLPYIYVTYHHIFTIHRYKLYLVMKHNFRNVHFYGITMSLSKGLCLGK